MDNELAVYQRAIELAKDQIADLKEQNRKLLRLAHLVAQDYEDAADWKDAHGRLHAMAIDAIGEQYEVD